MFSLLLCGQNEMILLITYEKITQIPSCQRNGIISYRYERFNL
jgi:hypothetical protein